MNRRSDAEWAERRLYRDKDRAWFFGVCAGVSEFFDVELWVVRLLTIISLLVFTMATIMGYLALAFLLKEKPLRYYGPEAERHFWNSNGRHGRQWR